MSLKSLHKGWPPFLNTYRTILLRHLIFGGFSKTFGATRDFIEQLPISIALRPQKEATQMEQAEQGGAYLDHLGALAKGDNPLGDDGGGTNDR
jgi:hypothetical protein